MGKANRNKAKRSNPSAKSPVGFVTRIEARQTLANAIQDKQHYIFTSSHVFVDNMISLMDITGSWTVYLDNGDDMLMVVDSAPMLQLSEMLRKLVGLPMALIGVVPKASADVTLIHNELGTPADARDDVTRDLFNMQPNGHTGWELPGLYLEAIGLFDPKTANAYYASAAESARG